MENPDSVSVVDMDTGSILADIPLSVKPGKTAVDSVLNLAVVSIPRNNTVMLIDLNTYEIISAIPVGRKPEGIAIDPEKHIAVVANHKDDTVSVIDLINYSVIKTIPVGRKPVDVAMDPGLNIALVVNEKGRGHDDEEDMDSGSEHKEEKKKDKDGHGDGHYTVSIIDLGRYQVTGTVTVGKKPRAIDINPETHTAVVANEKDNTVTVIDLATYGHYSIPVRKHPIDVAINTLDNSVLVLCEKGGKGEGHGRRRHGMLLLIDLNTGTMVREYSVDRKPEAVAVNPYTNMAGVIDRKTESLTLIHLPNPVPVITSVIPDILLRGSKTTGIAINGSGFTRSSVVTLLTPDTYLPTPVFINNHTIEAEIPPGLMNTTGAYRLTVTNPSPEGGTSNTVTLTIQNPIPAITALEPLEAAAGMPGLTLTVHGTGFFNDTTLSINGNNRTYNLINNIKLDLGLTAEDLETGEYLKITASNPPPSGGTSESATFTVLNPIPVLLSIDPTEVKAGSPGFTLTINGSGFVKTSVISINGQQYPAAFISAAQLQTTVSSAPVQAAGDLSISVTNPPPGGGVSASIPLSVTKASNVEPLPEGTFGKQYEDLVPSDATLKAYDPKRFSIITGVVKDRALSPLTGVTVSIHNHPEYGTARTDTAGRFSIPTEGGGTITIEYKKTGYITSHRKVYVPWNDIAIAEIITMITEDPVTTTVTFDGNPDKITVHKSSTVTDESGSRSLTMVFTGDNRAFTTDANGSETELTTITTRATEFDTPESMPARLPPTSAYTYAAELSVDGAEQVRFQKPVTAYVDNFLGFAVGEIVPVGYYDRERAVWVPSDNGVVVKLLDTDGDGIVDSLDNTGDGLPDDLNNNGSYSDEVTGLDNPAVYKPGTTYWRVEITHFSTWDCNWPARPPEDAIPPNPTGEAAVDTQQSGDDNTCTNSYVENRSRIYHEDVPLQGTDMTLHYASNRVSGYKSILTVPVSSDNLPVSLKSIIVKLQIAGRVIEKMFPPLPNQKVELIWDGLDYLGNSVNGQIKAHLSIGFVYQAQYYTYSYQWSRAFAQAGDNLTPIRAREEIISWKENSIYFVRNHSDVIASGWTLSNHHYMHPMDQSLTLYKGDGSKIKGELPVIETIAGNGQQGYSGDGGPATEASFNYITDIAVDKEGNIYVADTDNYRIRKIDGNGIITTVAGTGTPGYIGDGGPATLAQIHRPFGVAVDNNDNLYVGGGPIRKVDSNGIITTISGAGAGEGKIDIDNQGNIYFTANNTVRKRDPSGNISIIAGIPGYQGGSLDGIPATTATLDLPWGIDVDSRGNIYISEFFRIRKIDTTGIITTIAGSRQPGFSGDGGPAKNALFMGLLDVAVDNAGNIYISDSYNQRIRKIYTNGIIDTIAGSKDTPLCSLHCTGYSPGFSGDGGPAIDARLALPYAVALDGAGNIYIADTNNGRIRKISLSQTTVGYMPDGRILFSDEDGKGYILDDLGLHHETIDLATGITLYTFGYDGNNRLISITDRSGNVTTIQRDTGGTPLSITSPDGIRTSLTIDADNHLTKITYPDNTFYSFAYTPDGLLTDEYDPNGNHFEHIYDTNGRLTDVYDPEGGHWNYTRGVDPSGNILVTKTTAEGNITTYQDRTESTGAYQSTKTSPSGAISTVSRSSDGLTETTQLPCGMRLDIKYGLDPEYKYRYEQQRKETTPAGLIRLTTTTKTYEDTDGDQKPDLITDTETTNGKNRILTSNTLTGQKTATSPMGRTITLKYDKTDLLTKEIDIPGLNPIQISYDTRGRLTGITQLNRTAAIAYDNNGNMDYLLAPGNRKIDYTFDIMGRLKEEIRPDGTVLRYTYDNNGNMTVLTNPKNTAHTFTYTANDRRKTYTTPLSGSYQYTYDKERKLRTVTFPSGKTITNTYTNGLLTSINTPERTTTLNYDCPSKLGSMTRGTETMSYTYDGSLITSVSNTGTLNQTIGYSYNNDFRVSSINYAGTTQNLGYDSDGLLTAAGPFTITRNTQNGLPETVTDGTLTVSRAFNGYGEIDGYGYNIGGTDIYTLSITRDKAGRIVQRIEDMGVSTTTWDYAYDSLGRLTEVKKDGTVAESYAYDANGNRTLETNTFKGVTDMAYTYSIEDDLITPGTDTYQFDKDGFLTSKTTATGTTTYRYSSRGETQSVTLPDGTVISYDHDPMGRRIAKRINGTIAEKYLWSGRIRLMAVYDANDRLIMRFNYADERVPYSMEYSGQTYYLLYDQVGSLRAVVDNAGNIIKQIDYDSFGNIINDSNSSFAVPIGFAGGLYDADTGLVRFGARDYDPSIGRWTAKDPIDFAGGSANLFEYVFNGPVNLVDPYGLFGWDNLGEWIGKQAAKQIGKWLGKKIIPDKGLNLPEEGDDDNDGTPNFMDPDSEYCKVNCTKLSEPSECH